MTASQKGPAATDSEIDFVTLQIFEQYGLAGKKKLSFDDFLMLFMDQSNSPSSTTSGATKAPRDYLANVGLDFKGAFVTNQSRLETSNFLKYRVIFSRCSSNIS